MWEENPKYQRLQFGLFFGFLIILLLFGLIAWWLTGRQNFFIIPLCVLAGLVLSWACAALIMMGICKLIKKRHRDDR